MTRQRKKESERASVKAYGCREKPSKKNRRCDGGGGVRGVCVWGGVKSDNIKKRKGNGGVEKPSPLPVPCALRGDPGQVWGIQGMTAGTKPTTVPQREALFWARGVQEVSRSVHE